MAELGLDLSTWPPGTRAIAAERPHPGAQLSFTDHNGYRFQAFITNQRGCGSRASSSCTAPAAARTASATARTPACATSPSGSSSRTLPGSSSS